MGKEGNISDAFTEMIRHSFDAFKDPRNRLVSIIVSFVAILLALVLSLGLYHYFNYSTQLQVEIITYYLFLISSLIVVFTLSVTLLRGANKQYKQRYRPFNQFIAFIILVNFLFFFLSFLFYSLNLYTRAIVLAAELWMFVMSFVSALVSVLALMHYALGMAFVEGNP